MGGSPKPVSWWLYFLLRISSEQQQSGKKDNKIIVRTRRWLWAKHLFSAGMRCRTLISGRDERAAVRTLLLRAGLIADVSAVLAVHRHCHYKTFGLRLRLLRGVLRRSIM